MEKEEPLPTRDFAFDLLKELKVPYQVRKHSIKVAQKALEIAERINKVEVNKGLIEIGALLHDIGRSKTHSFKHALIGGRILKQRGLPESLVRICERHILGGLDKDDAAKVGLPERDFIPQSLEEKIICLADKHTAGSRDVSIGQRFEKWFSKYGKTQILIKSRKRIQEIQDEINSLI
jgi:uncharacterized protein